MLRGQNVTSPLLIATASEHGKVHGGAATYKLKLVQLSISGDGVISDFTLHILSVGMGVIFQLCSCIERTAFSNEYVEMSKKCSKILCETHKHQTFFILPVIPTSCL